MRGVLVTAAALVCTAAAAAVAQASTIVDRNAAAPSLRIAGATAIVNYRDAGVRRSARFSGAINARPAGSGLPQVRFRVVYSVGPQSGGGCRPYTGPQLPFLVTACDGADGSHWALQSWQRLLPDYGGSRAPWELHVSHWSGDLPKLEAWFDWSYGGRFQHLFGRYTYLGKPVFGGHSTSAGAPLDAYGRNVYVDTLDSAYGPGWHRENGFLTHKRTGVFCYGFYPHAPHPSGTGTSYRLSAVGPGVTPIVSLTEPALGGFDASLEEQMNELQRSLGDPLCRHA